MSHINSFGKGGGLYGSLVNYKDFKYKPLNHASALCAFGVDINRPILAPSGEGLPSCSNSLCNRWKLSLEKEEIDQFNLVQVQTQLIKTATVTNDKTSFLILVNSKLLF